MEKFNDIGKQRKTLNGVFIAAFCLAVVGCDAAPEQHGGEIEDDEVQAQALGFRGLLGFNGFDLGNGLTFSNGIALSNGVALSNGLAANTGLGLANGLAYPSGLSPTSGYMSTNAGRKLLKYLVECALPENDALVKGNHVFKGRVGLAPEWKYGQCGIECQQWVSACLLARTNEFGVSVKIDMRAAHPALGIGPGGAAFTEQEGAFFGNIFANPPRAYACQGTNVANAYLSSRTCTLGKCAIQEVDYYLCKNGCINYQGGTMASCYASTDPGSAAYLEDNNAVITTYLKPHGLLQ